MVDEHGRGTDVKVPPLTYEQALALARLFDVENDRAKLRVERRRYSGGAPKGLSRRSWLPGTPDQSNDEVLQSHRKTWEEGLARTPLWSLWHLSPEDLFRWRIEFDCGCIEERITATDDPHSLLKGSDDNWLMSECLPAGQYLCGRTDHERHTFPVRSIESWDRCVGERDLPADPVEVPERWRDVLSVDEWSAFRRESRTYKCWEATLSCGHRFSALMDREWTPDQGLRETPPEQVAEMRAEWADEYAPEPIPDEHARQLDAGWPQLYHYRDCHVCKNVRRPKVYQPLGWRVPPPPNPRERKQPATPEQRLRAELAKAEREARRLRNELKRFDQGT